MTMLRYAWHAGAEEHEFRMAWVPGTDGTPYLFGRGPNRRPIEVGGFYLATTPVTQALWVHVRSSNPAVRPDLRCPVENVSWEHVAGPGGFLDVLNAGDILPALASGDRRLRFRLPSETEWEYAARGGPRWGDEFVFSGSNDLDAVAWYGPRWTAAHEIASRLLGRRPAWRLINRARRLGVRRPTRTHPVGTKAPNQLGLHDMSGNVWEWCQDVCTDLGAVPGDGSPFLGAGAERRLRGGCHHNWDLHCTVSWRYGIAQDAHDGCIGFRVVLAPA